MRSAPLLLAALTAVSALGCAVFDAPPEVTIQGLTEGLLPDPTAPIVLVFSKPPIPSTVRIEIAKYIVDSNGLLGDQPGNTLSMPLQTLFTHDPVTGDTGGTDALAPDGSTMTITPSVPPPVGGQLVVLVAPGLSDDAGTVTKVRREIVFGYPSTLTCDAPVQTFQSGTYFFLVAVEEPFSVQLQLFGQIDVNSATGAFDAVFTKAKRNPDPDRCNPPCPSTDVCQLVPSQACVIPSMVAASVDEFSDYVPNPDAPTGFSFPDTGCAVQQGSTTAAFATAPTDVQVTMPMVTLRNTSLSSSFTPDSTGTLRGTGTLTADAVLLGTLDTGMGQGNITARSIAPADVPPGVPGPDGGPPTPDGG
jgi:hypothetical protein